MTDTRQRRIVSGLSALVAATALAVPGLASAATCTVTSASDFDPVQGPVVQNTLRWCVENVGNTDGVATDVQFAISGAGPHTINVVHELHIDENYTTVDGFTQSGSAPATSTTAAVHKIILDATQNTLGTVFYVDGHETTIRGLEIRNQTAGASKPDHAIEIVTSFNEIEGLALTDNGAGIAIGPGVTSTTIGGPTIAEGNVISGCSAGPGLMFLGHGTGNSIRWNTLTNNADYGVLVSAQGQPAAHLDFEDNVISGSGAAGIILLDTPGELVRTDVTGSAAFGIGAVGNDPSEPLVIIRESDVSGNGGTGIILSGVELGVFANTIQNNTGAGISVTTELNGTTSYLAASDDAIGHGVIGAVGDENTITGNVGGVVVIDAGVNEDLDTVNVLGGNTGSPEVLVLWPAFASFQDFFGNPLRNLEMQVWSEGGPAGGGMLLDEGNTDIVGRTVPSGSQSVDIDDVTTWMTVPQYVVLDDPQLGLIRFDMGTHEVFATAAPWIDGEYPWDGTPPGGGPKTGTCVFDDGICRYQRLEETDGIECAPGQLTGVACAEVPGLANGREAAACVPTSPPAGALPVVIGLHGLTSNISTLTNTNGGCRMIELAARDGFIAAFPQARLTDPDDDLSSRWRDCRTGTNIDLPPAGTNDVAFIENLVATIDSDPQIEVDKDRVYAWGHSNGGVMAYRLATEIGPTDLGGSSATPGIAGIGVTAANEPMPQAAAALVQNECSPPVAGQVGDILIMNGTEDTHFMPDEGGWILPTNSPLDPGAQSSGSASSQGAVRATSGTVRWSQLATANYWAQLMDVSMNPGAFSFADRVPVGGTTPVGNEDGSTVSVTVAYGEGDTPGVDDPVTGKILRLYRVAGGGHQVPGTPPRFAEIPSATTGFCTKTLLAPNPEDCGNQDISAPDEIWASFQPRLFWEDWEVTSPTFGWDALETFYWGGQPPSYEMPYLDSDSKLGPSGTQGISFPVELAGAGGDGAFLVDDLGQERASYRARFYLQVDYYWWQIWPRLEILSGYLDSSSYKTSRDPADATFTVSLFLDDGGNLEGQLALYAQSGGNLLSPGDPGATDGLDFVIGNLGAPAEPTLFEIQWRAATSGQSNGSLCIRRIDDADGPIPTPVWGGGKTEACIPISSTAGIDRVAFGVVAQPFYQWLEAGHSALLRFDDFESYEP